MYSSNSFAISLYNLARKLISGNFFMSPKNMVDAFGMLYPAARNESAEEFRRIFNFPDNPEELLRSINSLNQELDRNEGCTLRNVKAAWADKAFEFREEYLRLVREKFGAELQNVDYRDKTQHPEIVKMVNQWVNKQTSEKIPYLIDEGFINTDTVLVLVSAIYFYGSWYTAFEEKYTKDGTFYTTPLESKQVPLMVRPSSMLPYQETRDYQAVELLYEGSELSMIIVLPHSADKMVDIGSFDMGGFNQEEVVIKIPKWKAECSLDLKELLSELGMEASFTDQADFRDMIKEGTRAWQDGVKIDKAIHKAFIEVSEKGTEASAATAVGVVKCTSAIVNEPKFFTADHPFTYMIVHKPSNEILFIGRVSDPTVEN